MLNFLSQIGMKLVLFLSHLGFPLFGLEIVPDLIVVSFPVSSQFNGVELNFRHYHRIGLFVILAVNVINMISYTFSV